MKDQKVIYLDQVKPYAKQRAVRDVTLDSHFHCLKQLKQSIRQLEAEAAVHREEIEKFLGDAELLTDKSGLVLIEWKHEEFQKFDKKAFLKDYPTLSNRYLSTGQRRRFLIK